MKISPRKQHAVRTAASVVVAIPLAMVFAIGLIGKVQFFKELFEKGTFANEVFVGFTGLPHWAVFLAGFAFAVLAFRKLIFRSAPQEPTPEPEKISWLAAAKYADWDDIDPLALWQIANRWVGKQPPSSQAVEGSAYTQMIRLSEAIRTRKLKLAPVHGEDGYQTPEAALHGMMLRMMKPNDLVGKDTRISRGQLKAYAEKIAEKPTFLYPEVR